VEIEYASSFLRIYKKLHKPDQDGIKETTGHIIDYYVTGQKTLGLGIRQLRGDIWEGRQGIKRRIVYHLGEDRLNFLLAGSHDDIQNFLRRQ